MRTCLSIGLVFVLVVAAFSFSVLAGTSIQINYATVDVSTEIIQLHGINFDAFGPLSVTIGDTLLTTCTVNSTVIECSITGTPALSGGSWTVSVSAGNSPHTNEAIDVFVPAGLTVQGCNSGDFVECYSGDPSTKGVGDCQSGTRTCLSSGTWSGCEGETIPELETCGDGFDNDCDGQPDNGCSPQIFSSDGTFTVPAGTTQINVELWGAGGGGGGGGAATLFCGLGAQGGGGGGSGGYSWSLFTVASGETYNVIIGQAGIGGGGGANGTSGGDSKFKNSSSAELLSASGGQGGSAGEDCGGSSSTGAGGTGGAGDPTANQSFINGNDGLTGLTSLEGGNGGDGGPGVTSVGYGGTNGNGGGGGIGATSLSPGNGGSGQSALGGYAVIWW
jgi:hypothetical protein